MKKANDSVGCRELQQMLQYGTYQEQEEILRQLRGHVAEATAQAQQTVADEWRMQYKGSGYLKLGAVFYASIIAHSRELVQDYGIH